MALAVRAVLGYDDLQRWVATRNAASDDVLSVEMRALVRARESASIDLIAERDGEPVGIAFLSGDPRSLAIGRPWFDVRVLPEHRHRGVGSALLGEIVEQARRAGYDGLRCSADAADEASLAFLRRQGFSVTCAVEQVSLEVDSAPKRDLPVPRGVRLVRLAQHPDLVAAMYEFAVSTAQDRTDRIGGVVPSETDWRTYELSSPFVRLEMTVVAIADNTVVGYSIIQDLPGFDALLHRSLAVPPTWQEQGLGEALVVEAIRDAAAAGVPHLIAVPESPFEAELFASLGYRLRERWLEHARAL